jgi:hypothetical protein
MAVITTHITPMEKKKRLKAHWLIERKEKKRKKRHI